MRISLDWLRDFVELPEGFTAQQVADSLTMAGLEVEALEQVEGALDKTVLEVKITPNRPDALSHMGIARELAAILQVRTRFSVPTCKENGGLVHEIVHVNISAKEACPRYACRVIEGVKVGESPDWLKQRLVACGMRPVSNVVDVTNLILLERGHPLHAFDCDKLGKDRGRILIDVRKAKKGETMVTLDGQERKLHVDDLVITDSLVPVALAGIMGGQDSEVSETTQNVLLESAYFEPAAIRKTARRLGLHTEGSYRFERGCDPNGVLAALDRAAEMIAELAKGKVRREAVDVYPRAIAPLEISLRKQKLASISGFSEKLLDEAKIRARFLSLGIETAGRRGDALSFRVPTFRADLTREIDLIEEAMRLIGYDQVPQKVSFSKSSARGLFDAELENAKGHLRTVLVGLGFFEAQNFSFGAKAKYAHFANSAQDFILVENPLGEELGCMRASLVPGLMDNLDLNLRKGAKDVRLFEIGTIFSGKNPNGKKPDIKALSGLANQDAFANEEHHVAGVMLGETGPESFDTKRRAIDIYDLKGVLEELCHNMKISPELADPSVEFLPPKDPPPFLHPRMCGDVAIAGDIVGAFGVLHPDIQALYDIKRPVLVFSLSLDKLSRFAKEQAEIRPAPKFPQVERDLALLLDEQIEAQRVLSQIREQQALKPILQGLRVFDVYRGEKIPEGKKSMALTFVLGADDRTLTDEEVQLAMHSVNEQLQNVLGAIVR